MARTNNKGISYFSHDVDLSTDEKIQVLQADHGLIGYAVYVKLLERIYRNSYFMEADDRKIKIFAMSNNIDFESCLNIILTAVEEGLFNKKLYEKYKILTSKSIQIRYCEAISRRNSVEFDDRFFLLKSNVDILLKNVDINYLNVDIKQKNVDSSTQKKRKEKKEKEKIRKESIIFAERYFLNHSSISVSKKKQLESLIDIYGIFKLKFIIDRTAIYWKRQSPVRKYRFKKRWDKFYENISCFISDEALRERINEEVAWEKKKEKINPATDDLTIKEGDDQEWFKQFENEENNNIGYDMEAEV